MSFVRTPLFSNVLALIAGALLALAFAPINFFPLAIFCPAILLLLWLNADPKLSFWQGFLFGLGFFGVGTSWVFVSIHEFGNTNIVISLFLTGLFISVLALLFALQGYIFAYLTGRSAHRKAIEEQANQLFPNLNLENWTTITITSLFIFPALWVVFEWIRSWIFTGFPWLFLGASQLTSPLRGYMPIVGEYGVSFLVTLSSGLLVLILLSFKTFSRWPIYLFGLVFIWVAGFLLVSVQWTKPIGQPVKTSLIQGNIPQQMKWDPAYLQMILERYSQLTQNHWDSRIIIWPEAAIPLLQNEAQGFLDPIEQAAKNHHTAFITGIPIKDGFFYYNAVLALGDGHGVYYKRHLVPFGEYVPLDSFLRGLIGFFDIPMSNFSAGQWNQPNLQVAGLTIAPFVCYEVAYPQLVLSTLPQANLLLTVSNDAWFGHSFASNQHLQIAQVRALETQRYHLFSNSTGLSSIITPQGSLQAMAPAFQTTVLTGLVEGRTGSTPFIWLGIRPILILMISFIWIGSTIVLISVSFRHLSSKDKSEDGTGLF